MIFGIGLNKTATTSLSKALNMLGIYCVHHPTERQVRRLQRKKPVKFGAVCDWPIPKIWRQLAEKYPQAKFILTWRDLDTWVASRQNHVNRNLRRIANNPQARETWLWIDQASDKQYAKEHNDEVIKYFGDDPNFLLLNICGETGEQCWKKLCKFLDKPIPKQPFPHVNKGNYVEMDFEPVIGRYPIPTAMKSPKDRRPVWRGGVLQIWVTRSCDKSCFGCTQGSNLKGPFTSITVDQFREACRSLRNPNYFGVVGMFGGNPTTHKEFEKLCEVMREEIPYEQRGLWCNKLFGKGAICRETFNPEVSNINVHLDQDAADEFKRDWSEAKVKGLKEDSRHSPPYVALKDVVPDERERWHLISRCDINQLWSAMICVFRGELRAYFCEIAGAQAMLSQHKPEYPDLGHPVVPGWWNRPIQSFDEQIRHHCHNCGIPLKGYGELATNPNGMEQVSKTYQDIYIPKTSGRNVQLVTLRTELGAPLLRATDYIENGANPILQERGQELAR